MNVTDDRNWKAMPTSTVQTVIHGKSAVSAALAFLREFTYPVCMPSARNVHGQR